MIRELLNDKAVAGRRRLFFLYRGDGREDIKGSGKQT